MMDSRSLRMEVTLAAGERVTVAILNHMPLSAGIAIAAAVLGGYLLGVWLTRSDATDGLRKHKWLPW